MIVNTATGEILEVKPAGERSRSRPSSKKRLDAQLMVGWIVTLAIVITAIYHPI